ncbi:hypothetical protein ACN20G_07965 [Streptomyces sp. BI20]|uniref:hypothetical protein n=1 Tax=Streptomyces sp. BI20 TaxID=3403460 RepID=UPI003C7266F3
MIDDLQDDGGGDGGGHGPGTGWGNPMVENEDPRRERGTRRERLRGALIALGALGVAAAVVLAVFLVSRSQERAAEERAAPEGAAQGARASGARYAIPASDVCAGAEFAELSRLVAPWDEDPAADAETRANPAVDRFSCARRGTAGSQEPTPAPVAWTARMRVVLYGGDAAPEFAPGPQEPRDGAASPVPGLGEEAEVVTSPARDTMTLRVRDGGAVFTLVVSKATGGLEPGRAEPPFVDEGAVRAALIEDARAAMAAYRAPGSGGGARG